MSSVSIYSPAPPGLLNGNQITAQRIGQLIAELGYEVSYGAEESSILIALHAYRSAAIIESHPAPTKILILTGTDVYRDIERYPVAQKSLELANKIVVLQEDAKQRLTKEIQQKTIVIHQSVNLFAPQPKRTKNYFLTVANVRDIKNPLAAAKLRLNLPTKLIGEIIEERWSNEIAKEESENQNFQYLGGCSHEETLVAINDAKALVNASKMEGGAQVVVEALMHGTPVLASNIGGHRGILGECYPGLFDDSEQLRTQMLRLDHDQCFASELLEAQAVRKALFSERLERQAWQKLIERYV